MHYLTLLGRYYMSEQDYKMAAQTYAALVDLVPEDPQALAYAAQAQYLASDRALDQGARLQAEQALAADPHQRTALGLLGMASFEQGQYRAAIEYWQRLLVMEPAGSESAQMIQQVIDTATARLAGVEPQAGAGPVVAAAASASSAGAPDAQTPALQAPAAQTPAASAGVGVTVHISVPDDAVVAATDTVFVLARSADSDSRMPIAVQRLTAAQLPLTLRLDDSNSMAGQKLSEADSVIVAVQVSADGRPGEDNASWLGQVGPVAPSGAGETLAIVLQPKAP
jgi:cytochrome c-type biogenesis protein CcmH